MIYAGNTLIHAPTEPVTGAFVEVEGETYYRIANYDRMRPFFMSIVSDSDHWMFISSSGALTAGRKNPDHALFPYYTDDKIHDSRDLTGSKTLILAQRHGKTYLWEPFSERYQGLYDLHRNLYKSIYGNKIIFEEVNQDLGLSFAYRWSNGERFGFIKRSSIRNHGDATWAVRVLDGIQNILPSGVDRAMQSERSTLVDAYKKNELEMPAGLGIFSLSARIVDKPVPSEALRATTAWSAGHDPDAFLISSSQLERFRGGQPLETEADVRAERGAYFIHTTMELGADDARDWFVVAEVEQGPEDVVALGALLTREQDVRRLIEEDVRAGTERLKRIVGSADGLQCTEDAMTTARHYANVLFNVMRGGVFNDQYNVERDDLIAFLRSRNTAVFAKHQPFLHSLPTRVTMHTLLDAAADRGDAQLERLCYEYLPLTFSRRHGDPSRPWNAFSIDTRNDDGSQKLSYEGNWRDIFQNWEALGLSYPEFIEGMIAVFANASTPDGYNPYRITRDGIDWEILDPADAWSYIGYWGDHQIIYLLKLLELSRDHHPGRLLRWLTSDLFAYANVPYRIKPYERLLHDPHETIDYDRAQEEKIAERVEAVGADGKLIWDAADRVYLVNLTEKMLVAVLAKMANFIPEGGIWMNTQRPEWNDANNALVGYGVSMVTLYYLRRFQQFSATLFASLEEESVALSEEVVDFFTAIYESLSRFDSLLLGAINDSERKHVLDAIGNAASSYRLKIYESGFSGTRKQVPTADIRAFFERSLEVLDQTIRENQRSDKLFHAYNLISFDGGESIELSRLYEMLEGQVAVLSAGFLSGSGTLDVLDALKKSKLYRADQHSYLLYPDRQLPRFVERSQLSQDHISQSSFLQKLVEAGDRHIVVQDQRGTYHFSGELHDKDSVIEALDWLSVHGYAADVAGDRTRVIDLFESVFDHASYTGRSGAFYGYEGLGCIYWHMVSKLILAVKETYQRCLDQGEDPNVLRRLAAAYYDVREGVGSNKNPDEYGAFPSDPYSHTPGNAGAQQPGMTGQVKEDIIARWGELGVRVIDGSIHFQPHLLRRSEFLTRPATFEYVDVSGRVQAIPLDRGMLGFTYCQVPVMYRISQKPKIKIIHHEGHEEEREGLILDTELSASMFSRQGDPKAIEVSLMPEL